jgi:xanthosine utilization system XapX-like protein
MSSLLKRLVPVVVIIALLGVLGIRVGHPHSGLSSALGSASSSVVIYKTTKDLSVGSKYFGANDVKELTPVLGLVSEAGKDYYTIKNGKFLERVSKNQARGKMLVVIPFIGYLFSVVGL